MGRVVLFVDTSTTTLPLSLHMHNASQIDCSDLIIQERQPFGCRASRSEVQVHRPDLLDL
jgi:hypothetical protein